MRTIGQHLEPNPFPKPLQEHMPSIPEANRIAIAAGLRTQLNAVHVLGRVDAELRPYLFRIRLDPKPGSGGNPDPRGLDGPPETVHEKLPRPPRRPSCDDFVTCRLTLPCRLRLP